MINYIKILNYFFQNTTTVALLFLEMIKNHLEDGAGLIILMQTYLGYFLSFDSVILSEIDRYNYYLPFSERITDY